jgi:precorrin-2 methylase
MIAQSCTTVLYGVGLGPGDPERLTAATEAIASEEE